jgi:hypothetical protein
VFKVKWIARFRETRPIEVEDAKHTDLDKLVAFCQGQLIVKRLSHISNPPDGFLVCNEAEKELRRWLVTPVAPRDAITPSKESAHLPSRRKSRRSRAETDRMEPT